MIFAKDLIKVSNRHTKFRLYCHISIYFIAAASKRRSLRTPDLRGTRLHKLEFPAALRNVTAIFMSGNTPQSLLLSLQEFCFECYFLQTTHTYLFEFMQRDASSGSRFRKFTSFFELICKLRGFWLDKINGDNAKNTYVAAYIWLQPWT